ncbi:MAG: ferric reductase-like transmembrane domain-containing protein [Pseudomonadota bacterium]
MTRSLLIWTGAATALVVPLIIAATSPQLAWRGPVYIAAGFAGVIALGLLLMQPLLAGGYLAGPSPRDARRWHGLVGAALAFLVIFHVAALWWTSPPDVIDALLFRSPTPFSDWGVVAMWAVFATALLALLRRRLRVRPRIWQLFHLSFASVIVIGSVVHAMLIEGTMGTISKTLLCIVVVLATLKVIVDRKPLSILKRKKA